jgi:hypothetical protein
LVTTLTDIHWPGRALNSTKPLATLLLKKRAVALHGPNRIDRGL